MSDSLNTHSYCIQDLNSSVSPWPAKNKHEHFIFCVSTISPSISTFMFHQSREKIHLWGCACSVSFNLQHKFCVRNEKCKHDLSEKKVHIKYTKDRRENCCQLCLLWKPKECESKSWAIPAWYRWYLYSYWLTWCLTTETTLQSMSQFAQVLIIPLKDNADKS